jgi:AcrR family transcriptional regulator
VRHLEYRRCGTGIPVIEGSSDGRATKLEPIVPPSLRVPAMSDLAASRPAGLRERKKQRTRDAIVRSARTLFAKKGYEATTVAEIAAGAEISVPTLFSYFPTKEEVFFSDYPATQAAAERWIAARPEGQTAIESLLEWGARERPALVDRDRAWLVTYSNILQETPALQGSEYVRLGRTRAFLAEAIGRELGADAESLIPQLLAATAVVAITTVASVGRTHQRDAPDDDPYELIRYAHELLRVTTAAILGMPRPRY